MHCDECGRYWEECECEDEAQKVATSAVDAIVMRDIKAQMLKVAEEQPISNAGSFAMTLLWQIFEAASEHFEECKSLESYSDEYIEWCFKVAFPNFIANYPKVMELDI